MLGTGELIVILCAILLLFGGKKLPELARSLGIGIREFKKACYGEESSPCDQTVMVDPVTVEANEEQTKR